MRRRPSAVTAARRLVAPLRRRLSTPPHWAVQPEPPVCPAGWAVAPPDFVGVGVQRAGTTWWHRLLGAHPGIVPAQRKELHFFDRFWRGGFMDEDVERYHAHFPRPRGMLSGEWTPRYMHDFWTPRLLRRSAPAAKVLVMLRDPVERYRSGLLQETRAAEAGGALVASTAWADALARSRYAIQLDHLLHHFPREQVLILQYERCCAAPEHELRRTYDFLGVPLGTGLAPGLEARPASPSTEDALPRELRDDLVAALSADVRALAARAPEVELALWPNFSHLA